MAAIMIRRRVVWGVISKAAGVEVVAMGRQTRKNRARTQGSS